MTYHEIIKIAMGSIKKKKEQQNPTTKKENNEGTE